MKMLATKMMLAAAVALAILFSAEPGWAQRYHAAPQYPRAVERSWGSWPRFSESDQRIIDQITRNDRNSGY